MISALLYIVSILSGLLMSLRYGPVLIFMVYQIDYFLNPQNKWWAQYLPFSSAQFYLVLTMIIVFLGGIKKYGQNPAFRHPQFSLMWLVILTFALAYFNAPLQQYHLSSLDAFVTVGVVAFLIVKFCYKPQHVYWVIDAYLFSAFLLSFYIFGIGRGNTGRVEGVGMVDAPDANGVASALAPTVIMFLGRIIATPKFLIKGLYLIGLVFSLNAMILINSRGGFLGVAVGVCFFFFISFRNNSFDARQKGAIFLGLILLSAAFVRLADDSFLYRMATIREESTLNEEAESGSTRVFFWKAAWNMAKDHPFGAGAGGFQYYGDEYIPDHVATGGSRVRAVHSTWFEALSETGYLGLAFFTLMIISSIRAFELARRRLLADKDFVNSAMVLSLSSGLITFIVAMTFINRMRGEVLYWFVALSVCCVNIFLSSRQAKP